MKGLREMVGAGKYKRTCKKCGSTRFKKSGLYYDYYCQNCNTKYEEKKNVQSKTNAV